MESGNTTGSVLHLWTAQEKEVMDAIREKGFSQVKLEYIDRKYGESAWAFREAYSFFSRRARTIVGPPEGAESPIWLYGDRKWVYVTQNSCLLELRIPRERAVLFHRERWQRVLNLAYVGKDGADEAAFEEKMERMGVSSYYDVFRSAFYPYLKSEIKKSWERIFDVQEEDQSILGAAVWQLKSEDIIDITTT